MKANIYLLGISFLMLSVGCSSDDEKEVSEVVEPNTEQSAQTPEERDVTRGINLTETQKEAVKRNNNFVFNLYRQISQTETLKGKSLVTSPVSCTYALSMLNSGAKGQTSDEIVNLLGFSGSSTKEINELCQTLIIEAPLVDNQVELKLANALVANKQIEILEQYRKDLEGYYIAETFSKDFSQSSTLSFINEWCNTHTEGAIKQILDELPADMKVLLMNAVYFKAGWYGKFDKKETTDENFTKENGDKVTMPIMHRYGATSFTSCGIYSTIALPYGKGNRWNMYVLLPTIGFSVSDILASLTQQSWNENKSNLIPVEIDVKLPRFKTESDINLTEIIESLGAKRMFSSIADFSSMVRNDNLFVSMIKQKAVVEVSEEGTEAAAVTPIKMYTSTGDDDTPHILTFHATRPFVYLIQEETSGAIFFMGTYTGE